uniref:Uncharacterized protein n=1 Tax=Prevotella sp. GTC17254 TaxID=3236794 RepID=A0AB33ISA3_9BACT
MNLGVRFLLSIVYGVLILVAIILSSLLNPWYLIYGLLIISALYIPYYYIWQRPSRRFCKVMTEAIDIPFDDTEGKIYIQPTLIPCSYQLESEGSIFHRQYTIHLKFTLPLPPEHPQAVYKEIDRLLTDYFYQLQRIQQFYYETALAPNFQFMTVVIDVPLKESKTLIKGAYQRIIYLIRQYHLANIKRYLMLKGDDMVQYAMFEGMLRASAFVIKGEKTERVMQDNFQISLYNFDTWDQHQPVSEVVFEAIRHQSAHLPITFETIYWGFYDGELEVQFYSSNSYWELRYRNHEFVYIVDEDADFSLLVQELDFEDTVLGIRTDQNGYPILHLKDNGLISFRPQRQDTGDIIEAPAFISQHNAEYAELRQAYKEGQDIEISIQD